MLFDRRVPGQGGAARACITDMHDVLRVQGCAPFRLGVQDMWRWTPAEEPFWATVAEIGKALDPDAVIAPGRYSPR